MSVDIRLEDTRRAFDRVAAAYDGPAGNNIVIQRMRSEMWQTLTATFPAGARLLDLGCGTGLDAAYLARRGYSVVAIDWSPAMVERTRARITAEGLQRQASARLLGMHELHQLKGERFDGIYSNLGALNCALDLSEVARACAGLLRPPGQPAHPGPEDRDSSSGRMVASVIGRICPWEIAYFVTHARWNRAFLRWRTGAIPVPLNGETVWTRYFTPRQFYQAFAGDFELTWYRGLRIFSPPPYMLGIERRLRPVSAIGEWLDDRLGALPPVRNAGDHFLIVLTTHLGGRAPRR